MHQLKISQPQLLIEMLIECWLSVHQGIDEVSIKCQPRNQWSVDQVSTKVLIKSWLIIVRMSIESQSRVSIQGTDQ